MQKKKNKTKQKQEQRQKQNKTKKQKQKKDVPFLSNHFRTHELRKTKYCLL